MTQDEHHTTAEERERPKAEQARDDARWRPRRGRGEDGRPRTFLRDLWDWLVGAGSALLGVVLIVSGSAPSPTP